MVGDGAPDLLAVEDVVVAVLHRARAQRSEVGARFRLGVALAPDVGAGEHAGQPALLLLLGAVDDDRRAGHAQADDQVSRAAAAR